MQISNNLNLDNFFMFKILINLIPDHKKMRSLDSKIWIKKILLEKKFNKKNLNFFYTDSYSHATPNTKSGATFFFILSLHLIN
jgi:hypothetical protein